MFTVSSCFSVICSKILSFILKRFHSSLGILSLFFKRQRKFIQLIETLGISTKKSETKISNFNSFSEERSSVQKTLWS